MLVSPSWAVYIKKRQTGTTWENAMAYQPAPNTMQANVRYSLDGQQVENVLHFEQATTPTTSDCAALANVVENWAYTSYLDVVSSSLSLTEVYVRSLNTAAAPEATDNTHSGATGNIATPALPNNVTWAVKFLTGLTGRSYRGRAYCLGLGESMCLGSSITLSFATDIVTAWEQLITDALGADFTPVVLSRVQNHVVLPNAIGAPILTVGYTDLVLDSQRRRLPGRGS